MKKKKRRRARPAVDHKKHDDVRLAVPMNIRLEQPLYAKLQKQADVLAGGNVSALIRSILQSHFAVEEYTGSEVPVIQVQQDSW